MENTIINSQIQDQANQDSTQPKHSVEKLKALYDELLESRLAGMESQRKSLKRHRTLLIIGGIIVFFLIQSAKDSALSIVVNGIGILAMLFGIGYWVVKYYKYRKAFKDQVVVEIIKLINPSYHYDANRHISATQFNESQLFSSHAERCQGDDFVSGKIEKTEFQFSELCAEYKTTETKDGKREETWHTIFRGLFFHADFNKNIIGKTFVMPDTAEKLFGKWGQKLQSGGKKGKLVRLENPIFEKEFAVFAGDQTEARYILTPTMMEAMVNIQQKYKRKFHFAFVGSRVYCAVSFNKGLFEPTIGKSGVNFAMVEEMYHLFGLIETIIHEMNLNTRIWTKE